MNNREKGTNLPYQKNSQNKSRRNEGNRKSPLELHNNNCCCRQISPINGKISG